MSSSTDNFNHKTHYVKATAKAGQVYRLLAVFQDGDHKSASSQKDTASVSGNVGSAEKERGKYAQLLGDNRQVCLRGLDQRTETNLSLFFFP